MTRSHTPQRIQRTARGGAMLGLILGLIIGLAVALAVAIYVAKVPIPFVNQVPVHNGGQDAAETEKNRNWNPNASLQTRGPVLSASDAGSAVPPAGTGNNAQQQPSAVPVPPPVEVQPPDEPVDNNPAPPSRPVTRPVATGNTSSQSQSQNQNHARPPVSNDPLGDFAAAHAARTAANTGAEAATDPFSYFVQTGAFSTPQDADAQRARLSLLGMEAAITERDQTGRIVYRVRVGPFQNKVAADQIKERLSSNGFDAALVRVQR